MANDFQTTSSGSGELKNVYDNDQSSVSEALKRKRKKLSETKMGTDYEEDETPGQ